MYGRKWNYLSIRYECDNSAVGTEEQYFQLERESMHDWDSKAFDVYLIRV